MLIFILIDVQNSQKAIFSFVATTWLTPPPPPSKKFLTPPSLNAIWKTLYSAVEVLVLVLLTSWKVSVQRFRFDEFDDSADGFCEFSENEFVSIAFRSKENMSHFWKPVFISPTVMDSLSSFENFVEMVLQQSIGSFH